MANTIHYYRLYLTEPVRKALGINLRYKQVYLFHIKGRTYLSTNVIPKNGKTHILNAKIVGWRWAIDLPKHLCIYEPKEYRFVATSGRVIEILPELLEKNKK